MFLNLELLFFMTHEGQNAPASEAGGAGGGGPGNRTPRPLWFIDEKIRKRLHDGVGFENGRRLGVVITPDVVWIKVDEKAGYVTAMYMKGSFGVTVHAKLRGDDVEIHSVSLDCMCQGRSMGGP